MLQPKNIITLLLCCLFSFSAKAELYGLVSNGSLTKEELNKQSLFLDKNLINYPKEMRDNVIMLSKYAKNIIPNFQIIVHEGQDLITSSNYEEGVKGFNNIQKGLEDKTFLSKKQKNTDFKSQYLNAIDGTIKNDVFFKNGQTKYMSDANVDNVEKFADVKNYWLAIDDSLYSTKEQKIQDVFNSNHDIVIINPMFKNVKPFTKEEVSLMSLKKNGAQRLIIAHVDVSEISKDDYRINKGYVIGSPEWLARESLVKKDYIITKYWQDPWKVLLSRHFKAVVKSGYDGAFLTGADNHKYFEKITPVE